MRLVSWNINSLRARIDQLEELIKVRSPDVICLQEIKVENEKYPTEHVEGLGYRSLVHGQKSWNGVAILTRFGLSVEGANLGLDGDDAEAPRRAVAATVEGVRVINVYVPNGQAVGTPTFDYKLAWLERLEAELRAHASVERELVVCGDFNVAPEPIDVFDPVRSEGRVCFHPAERARVKRLLDWGLVDVVRAKHPERAGLFSWWDYRQGSFKKNVGLRLDLALCTKPLAARVTSADVDRDFRKLDKPSDHAPVMIDLAD